MNNNETLQRLLHQYDENVSLYKAFTEKLDQLLSDVLLARSIFPHSVTSRVKNRRSLQEKLERPDASYEQLTEITDISGLRITTYFYDDVDKVASCLAEEFEILQEYSVDKRKLLDPDRFGYVSLHYIARLSKDRRTLTEYRRFPELRCEIQVRSVLQHAWAEIEHDLGYKTKIAIPQTVRRRFSRLAGLLELADEEFVTIRDELNAYRDELPHQIEERSETVTLDRLSLEQFLRTDPVATDLDNRIASFCGARIVDDSLVLENWLKHLSALAIKTVSDLSGALTRNKDAIISFAVAWLKPLAYPDLKRGICTFYLSYVLLAKNGDVNFAQQFLSAQAIGKPEEREQVAHKILATYQSLNAQ